MENGLNDVKIIVATHKKYKMPADDMYLPVHVGAEGKKDADGNALELGYAKDNTGDNISDRNSNFCELTGLYWAWKNLKSDYLGLVHYRRYFCLKRKGKDPFDSVLTRAELEPLLRDYKVFVPKKRRYYIETLYSHYMHTHFAEHLDLTRQIIAEKCPEYLSVYDRVLDQPYGYMFNMMIMKRELLDQYCIWVFDILFELEKRVGDSDLSFFQGRFYGRVSEIIFNVWLAYQIETGVIAKEEVKELPYIYMEKIDWFRKVTAFLKAKFLHQKYEGSF